MRFMRVVARRDAIEHRAHERRFSGRSEAALAPRDLHSRRLGRGERLASASFSPPPARRASARFTSVRWKWSATRRVTSGSSARNAPVIAPTSRLASAPPALRTWRSKSSIARSANACGSRAWSTAPTELVEREPGRQEREPRARELEVGLAEALLARDHDRLQQARRLGRRDQRLGHAGLGRELGARERARADRLLDQRREQRLGLGRGAGASSILRIWPSVKPSARARGSAAAARGADRHRPRRGPRAAAPAAVPAPGRSGACRRAAPQPVRALRRDTPCETLRVFARIVT